MKTIALLLIPLLVLGGLSLDSWASTQDTHGFDPIGLWVGSLSFGGTDLRIVVRIVKTQDGILNATMDSPDQGAKDIPVDSVTIDGNKLILELRSIHGSYAGTFNPGTREIEGTWTQGISLPLKLKRADKVPEIVRPQEPKRPFPYLEEEVSYENENAGIELAGTLTEPKSGGPFPAALLITGSGAQDRDEMILGHKPFMVIADYLTRRGLAVLRVDDRGVGGTTGLASAATSEDLAGDVLTGILYLKSRSDIDGRRIGLIGHSEGGIIAPMVAARSSDVAFIVLLAGTGVTGEEILYEQGELITRAEGATEDVIAKNREFQKKSFAVLKENADPKVIEERLKPLLAEAYQELPEELRKAYGGEEAWAKGQMEFLTSPWFKFFLTYDPKPVLNKVACPVLALGGSKDLQVPAGRNLKAIGEALQAGGNTNFKTIELSGLNHLFQASQTGAVSEYSRNEETFSPLALETIGEWILSVVGQKK
ncbi:MAG: alpha/beta fold hydrolase [Candidatus Krumholzibacteria bacterium]|nr:alpha/beta fold hydrolase [Candidatus Krumholzibacteria bacterium]